MASNPKVSVVVPIHDMKNGQFFLWRLVNSLTSQTFKDWELIITKDGRMAENTNSGIMRARGEWIKILYLDDYFSDKKSLGQMLGHILDAEHDEWAICGTNDNIYPHWTDDVQNGNNKLGSPSAIMFRNHFEDNLLFDENLSWLLDGDLYKRLKAKFGYPVILPGDYITIGKHDGQMTHILTDEQKLAEHVLMKTKHG